MSLNQSAVTKPVPVVAIGGSAGGMQAKEIFQASHTTSISNASIKIF